MNNQPASLYLDGTHDLFTRIEQSLLAGLAQLDSSEPIPILFRADDIGVLSAHFSEMMRLFNHYHLPLCLAVVPTWLTRRRWDAMGEQIDTGSDLWCWHQHGWNHANHEPSGKKNEFGPTRTAVAMESEIRKGRDRLVQLIGKDFQPFFTPPWNRCSQEAIRVCKNLGFRGISRSRGEQKEPAALPDFYINVDLHTRKEADQAAALEGLCGEFRQAINDRCIGVMIHHQRMNDKALHLLDRLLEFITDNPRFALVGFRELEKWKLR